MKKILLAPLASFSQSKTEPDNYRVFFKQFKNDFNNSNWGSIITTASDQFLKSIPEKKLTDFLSGIKNSFGNIIQSRYKYFDEKNSAVYHAAFQNTWFSFIIRLNEKNKMERLLVIDPNYNEVLPPKLPFDDEWSTFWGGDKEDENYHVTNRAQKNAFDFLVRDAAGRSFRSTGKINEDYFAFGKKLYAPCDGEVIMVIDGIVDNVPGKMNPSQLTGNTVVMRTARNEYVLLAHLKMNSTVVHKGQWIKKGNYIGLCGNSGNSSEPHLHLHMMDGPELGSATGIKCYFDKLVVNDQKKSRYSPVRGDRIRKK
jgi:murein DD-endopeptidase MepM/ murein hydrolase activator NlpD